MRGFFGHFILTVVLLVVAGLAASYFYGTGWIGFVAEKIDWILFFFK